MVEESAYTDEQLLGYDKFWDIIRTERTIFNSAIRRGHRKGYDEGHEKGFAEGSEKGRAEGRVEGKRETAFAIARKMRAKGLPVEDIRDVTGLTAAEIEQLPN